MTAPARAVPRRHPDVLTVTLAVETLDSLRPRRYAETAPISPTRDKLSEPIRRVLSLLRIAVSTL